MLASVTPCSVDAASGVGWKDERTRLCQLKDLQADRRERAHPVENEGLILGKVGEFAPGYESRRELCAME
jgi:hypothetical protein